MKALSLGWRGNPSTLFTTTTMKNSPQHQATGVQHSYARSSIPIYSEPPSLHPPRKFLFPLNLSL